MYLSKYQSCFPAFRVSILTLLLLQEPSRHVQSESHRTQNSKYLFMVGAYHLFSFQGNYTTFSQYIFLYNYLLHKIHISIWKHFYNSLRGYIFINFWKGLSTLKISFSRKIIENSKNSRQIF